MREILDKYRDKNSYDIQGSPYDNSVMGGMCKPLQLLDLVLCLTLFRITTLEIYNNYR